MVAPQSILFVWLRAPPPFRQPRRSHCGKLRTARWFIWWKSRQKRCPRFACVILRKRGTKPATPHERSPKLTLSTRRRHLHASCSRRPRRYLLGRSGRPIGRADQQLRFIALLAFFGFGEFIGPSTLGRTVACVAAGGRTLAPRTVAPCRNSDAHVRSTL